MLSHSFVANETGHLDIYSDTFTKVLDVIRKDYDRRNNEGGRQHPWKAMDLLKEHRFGAITLPEELGGAEATHVDLFSAAIRLAEADPDVAHIFRAHFMTVRFLLQDRNPAAYAMLKKVQEGAVIGNAYTENSKHRAGESQYDTKLEKENGHYRLHGEKAFTTGTYYADYTEVTAMLADEPIKVILPVDREGVTLNDNWDGFVQKMTGSGTTSFHHVFVSEGEVFSSTDREEGYAPIPHLYIQGIIAGIMKRIASDAVELIGKRKRSFFHGNTTNLKQDPQLQHVIGELSSYAFAAEAMVLAAARSIDRVPAGISDLGLEHQAALDGSKVKVAIEELAFQAATKLFDVGGASATKQSANLDRHWRNIRTLASHNPTPYKARVIGNYDLNGELLPANAYF